MSSSLAKPARRSAKPRRPIKRSLPLNVSPELRRDAEDGRKLDEWHRELVQRDLVDLARQVDRSFMGMKRSKGKAGSRTSKRRKARKAGKLLCDRLWAQVIKRDGRCVFKGQILSRGEDEEPPVFGCDSCVGLDWARTPHVCAGPLQAMHCIPKGPYPSARYKLWNGIPGCAGAHTYFTHRPEIFVLWLQSRWGDALYAERLRDANYPAKHDYAAIAAKLQERLP